MENAKRNRSDRAGNGASNAQSKGVKQRRTATPRRKAASRPGQHGLTLNPALTSLIGAGLALGVGLFSTRHRWMPITESWNDTFHDWWAQYSGDGDDGVNSDQEHPGSEVAAAATFPGHQAAN